MKAENRKRLEALESRLRPPMKVVFTFNEDECDEDDPNILYVYFELEAPNP